MTNVNKKLYWRLSLYQLILLQFSVRALHFKFYLTQFLSGLTPPQLTTTSLHLELCLQSSNILIGMLSTLIFLYKVSLTGLWLRSECRDWLKWLKTAGSHPPLLSVTGSPHLRSPLRARVHTMLTRPVSLSSSYPPWHILQEGRLEILLGCQWPESEVRTDMTFHSYQYTRAC